MNIKNLIWKNTIIYNGMGWNWNYFQHFQTVDNHNLLGVNALDKMIFMNSNF